MSLVDDLDHIRRRLGRSIVLPTPPACQDLLDLAQAAGIPVVTLFVLSRALAPGVLGSYDRRSGAVWCHYNGADDDGASAVLQCILTLLAHVKLHLPPPTTIEEDWEQAHAAHQEAATLARAWDREHLFSASDLEAFLAYDRHLSRCHVSAGNLAGTLDPSIARDAYRVLRAVQQRYQWSDAQFEAALGGVRDDDDEANAVVVDFDRCALRTHWLSTSTRTWADEPFGMFALAQTPRTARVLRSALERGARRRAENGTLRAPLAVEDRTSLSFFYLQVEHDLSLVIERVNVWLLEDLPECSAQVHWTLYADRRWRETTTPSPHLYHMSVAYASCHGQADEENRPIQRELWILVPARKREEIVEAAWQRYIRSWLAGTDLRTDALYYGLQALWPWLQQ